MRRRALVVFEKVVDRAEDVLAPLLSTIVLHMSEVFKGESARMRSKRRRIAKFLFADTNRRVTRQAGKVLEKLQRVFGADVMSDK